MSIRFFDGFETEQFIQQSQNVEGSNPTYDVIVDIVRSGLRALNLKSGSYYTYCEKSIDNTTNMLIVGFGINVSRIHNNNHYFFRMGHDHIFRAVEFRFVDSKLQVSTKDEMGNTIVLAQPNKTYSINTQYWFEAKLIVSPNDGTIFVMNDYTNFVCDVTHSLLSRMSNPHHIRFLSRSSDSASYDVRVDDVYVMDGDPPDNTFLGKISIVGSFVDGGGHVSEQIQNDTQVIPYRLLKERYGDTTTYVYTDTTNSKSFFSVNNIPNVGTIKSVLCSYYVAKLNQYSDDVTVYLGIFDTTSQNYYYIPKVLNNHEFTNFYQVLDKNPINNSEWIFEDFNNLEFGIKY